MENFFVFRNGIMSRETDQRSNRSYRRKITGMVWLPLFNIPEKGKRVTERAVLNFQSVIAVGLQTLITAREL
jgi:hypothetical protein